MLRIIIVPVHQPAHPVDGIVVELQPAQNSTRHLASAHRMSVKMIDSCLIRCLAYRLCNIVKQCRQTQDFLILYLLYHMDRMLSHRITVMRIVLLCLHQYGKLRQYHIGDPACIDFPDQFLSLIHI